MSKERGEREGSNGVGRRRDQKYKSREKKGSPAMGTFYIPELYNIQTVR